ncbi:hypothetical protein OH77DRAFT_1087407 [Trametes cingulata]|nr:hypothetical protein OH77DRAFT_1087407 [Trametes cingulata]
MKFGLSDDQLRKRLDGLAAAKYDHPEGSDLSEVVQFAHLDMTPEFFSALDKAVFYIRTSLNYPTVTLTSVSASQSESSTAILPSNPFKKNSFEHLPVDITLHLATWLHPLDILHCARTCKQLRSVFLSPISRPPWRAAFRSVHQLPACPEDMSMPLYAALLFDRFCFACGVDGALSVDYALRVRLCESCYEANVCEGWELLENVPKAVREVVMMLLPRQSTAGMLTSSVLIGRHSRPMAMYLGCGFFYTYDHDLDPLTHALDDFYYRPALEGLLQRWWPLSAAGYEPAVPVMAARLEYVSTRAAHALLLEDWKRVVVARSRCEDWQNDMEFEESVTLLYTLLNTLDGLGHALPADEEFDSEAYTRVPGNGLAQFADETETRAAHLAAARTRRVRRRLADLETWFIHMLQNHFCDDHCHELSPNRHEGGRMLADLAEDEGGPARGLVPSEERYSDGVLGGLVASVGYYEEDMRKRLGEVLGISGEMVAEAAVAKKGKGSKKKGRGRKGRYHYSPPPMEAVEHPKALYVCRECDDDARIPRGFPDIHGHWRKAHPDASIWVPEEDAPSGHRPSKGIKLGPWREGQELVPRILAAAGFGRESEEETERKTPSVAELEELLKSGRLFCACGDPALPPPEELSWVTFVHHIYEHVKWYEELSVRHGEAADCPGQDTGDGIAVLNDHVLELCVKLMPEQADTGTGTDESLARVRVRADADVPQRIAAHVAQCPENAALVCRLCRDASEALALSNDDAQPRSHRVLPNGADHVVYHLRAKHGAEFMEGDVLFLPPSSRALQA